MLGICTAARSDSSTSAAELTFGTALGVLGQFFDDSPTIPADVADYAYRLHRAKHTVASPSPPANDVLLSVNASTLVLRTARTSFCTTTLCVLPYGPRMMAHSNYCVLLINGREYTVSVDRLKPAYLDSDALATSITLRPHQGSPTRRVCLAPPPSVLCQSSSSRLPRLKAGSVAHYYVPH
nr:uncharacterized protein LOC126529868 [Dermacentor andersoni]